MMRHETLEDTHEAVEAKQYEILPTLPRNSDFTEEFLAGGDFWRQAVTGACRAMSAAEPPAPGALREGADMRGACPWEAARTH